MNQDQEHLRLLSIFHYVCAGIVAFFACIPFIHLALGLTMALRPETFGSGRNQPPAVFAWFLVIFASVIILFGWTLAVLLVLAGRCLGRRKNYTFCLVVGCAACLFMPFGTVLGVFSIVVLVRPSVKALFQAPLSSANA